MSCHPLSTYAYTLTELKHESSKDTNLSQQKEGVTSNTTNWSTFIFAPHVLLEYSSIFDIRYVLYVLLDEDFNLHLCRIIFVLVRFVLLAYNKTSRTRSDKRGKYIALCHTATRYSYPGIRYQVSN